MADTFLESVIGFNIGGNYAAVVHHWRGDDSGGETAFEQAEDLAAALETDIGASVTLFERIQAIMASDCFISSIRTRRLSGGGGATYAKLFGTTDYPGIYSGNTDAAMVAGCMLKYTATDPKVQGRTFWPGISEEALLGGRFVIAWETEFGLLMTRYLEGFTNDITWTAVLKHGPIPTYTTIVACENSPTPGTIRRRLVPV